MKVSVTKSNDEWRSAPWTVRYHHARKSIRRFFETKEEADQYAKEIRESLRRGVDPAELSEACRLLAGTGHKLPNIVRAGLQFLLESDAARMLPTATFSDGVGQILANAKYCRKKTIVGYRYCFRRLQREFGSKVAAAITNRDVQLYLDALPDRFGNAGKASPFTKKTILCHIRMVLRVLGIANPLPKLVPGIPKVREIKFFSTDEIRAILAAAAPSERGMVALAVFAAIRPLTLERLPAACVSVADKTIRIPGELSKDHRPHCLETVPIGNDREVRPGPPEVLWEWLQKYPFQPRAWSSVQRRLRQALNGKWIQDGLRHSGATYFRAKYGDAATAELLTHASIKLVNEHYAGLATRAQAEAFLAIHADSVPLSADRPSRRRKNICWPADAELAALLTAKPATHVAKALGCSDSMITRRCKRRGILKPGRGAWSH